MVKQINAQIATQQLLFRYRVARRVYLQEHDRGAASDFVVDLSMSPPITGDHDANDFYRAVFYDEPTNSMSTGDLDQIRKWVLRGQGELPAHASLALASTQHG